MSRNQSADLQQPLAFDDLESRVMLAGDVDVVLSGGNLIITGDPTDNSIEINGFDNDRIVISGLDGTTINRGEANGSINIDGDKLNNIEIRMRAGRDEVYIQNNAGDKIKLDGSLIFRGGRDDDRLEVGFDNELKAKSIDANGGDDRDQLVFGREVETDDGNSIIQGGRGDDSIQIQGAKFEGALRVLGDSGDDEISLIGVEVEDGRATLSGGGGNDTLINSRNDFEDGLTVSDFED